MRRFNRVGARHYEDVKIVGGPTTRALIQRPPDIDRPGAEFTYPSPTLRVPVGSLVKSGQVVRIPSGDHYLVADHSATTDWVTHHLFRCDRQVPWGRFTMTADPVTKVMHQSPTPATLGNPWVMWERVRREFTDLTIRVSQETLLVAVGAQVELNDILNSMKVVRKSHALGVTIVELQG